MLKKAALCLLLPLAFLAAMVTPCGAITLSVASGASRVVNGSGSNKIANTSVINAANATVASIHAAAQIVGVQTNGIYHYTITLSNTGAKGDPSINTFWFAWVPGQDFLPSSPTNIHAPGAWMAQVFGGGSGNGYSIRWVNSGMGVAIAPGQKSAQFSFDLTNAPSELAGNSVFYTNIPVGTSFVYSGTPFVGSSLQFVVTMAPDPAALYTVSNLNDSGFGSLRQALVNANANTNTASNVVISFTINGTITLANPLPLITKPVTIDGTSAPGFTSNPVVSVDFTGKTGLTLAPGSKGSVISSLSWVGAGSDAITLQAPNITVQGNFIGFDTNSAVHANFGDGLDIVAPSGGNLIGSSDPVQGVTYESATDSNDFPVPVTAWQGLRNNGTNAGEYLICGTSAQTNGLLYIGPIGGGGASYSVQYTDANTNVITTVTSVYGPDNLTNGGLRLVGSYRKSGDTKVFNHGFVWEGTTNDLPTGGTYRTIDYPGAKYQFTHSTMGGLAVGNADGPKKVGNKTLPIGPGVAYIYNVVTNGFVTIPYPGAKSVTAYGIWYNGGTSYTICGGYSPVATNNLTNQDLPLTQGKGYLIDFDSVTRKFTHAKSFDYPNGPAKVNFITHFEGISGTEPGVYTLSADSVQAGTTNPVQGSWVSVRRNSDGSFDNGRWVDLNADNSNHDGGIVSSANSVYGNQVVGIVAGADSNSPLIVCTCGTNTNVALPFAYQATVNVAFQRSNVIGGNTGNGIVLNGSKGNIIAMNYIGTDVDGSTNTGFGNGANGILLTNGASGNLIGGQAAGSNNPTGVPPIFDRPLQGNLISGNTNDGVLITASSSDNLLSGNFIGVDATGTNTIGNGQDGVGIENSKNNSIIGSALNQNPLAFYNVIGGNGRDGITLNKANNTIIQDNQIEANTQHGIFATGPCAKSVIKGDEISNNGTNSPTDNVDIHAATGIIYTP